MPNEESFLSMMIETLKLLACGYEEQKAALPEYVYLPDELVLSFDEAYTLFDQVVDAGLVTSVQVVKVEAVRQLFDFMQQNKEIEDPWTYEAVESSANWYKIRALARNALAAFNITDYHPNLSWVTYVGGDGSADGIDKNMSVSKDHAKITSGSDWFRNFNIKWTRKQP